MRSLIEIYIDELKEYDEDLSLAKVMKLNDSIMKQKIGKRTLVINESGAGPARIFNMIRVKKYPFIQLTASKGCELSKHQNLKRNAHLTLDIQSQGLIGMTHMLGSEYCGEEEKPIEEMSFFIPFIKSTGSIKDKEDLKKLGMSVCKTYGQWGFIYGDGENVYLMDSNGNMSSTYSVMSFDVSVTNKWWSKIKGRKYKFESIVRPDGMLQSQVFERVYRNRKRVKLVK